MIEEMEIVIDGAGYWPQPPKEVPQARRKAVGHLCHRCLTTLERHSGDGVSATYWCPGCGGAGTKLAEVCCCGVTRAGARLKCSRLAGEDGGLGEVVVIEAEAPDVGRTRPAPRGAAAT